MGARHDLAFTPGKREFPCRPRGKNFCSWLILWGEQSTKILEASTEPDSKRKIAGKEVSMSYTSIKSVERRRRFAAFKAQKEHLNGKMEENASGRKGRYHLPHRSAEGGLQRRSRSVLVESGKTPELSGWKREGGEARYRLQDTSSTTLNARARRSAGAFPELFENKP